MTLSIHSLDLAIVCVYMAATVAFGLWIGRNQRDLSDYLLGGRNLPWWAVLGSIVATETSTVTFLSVPGLAFAQGGDLRFLQLAFGYVVGRIVVTVLLLPSYFQGQLYTAYEVLHRRFGGTTKSAASVLFLVTRNLADGLRLYLTAIVLEKVVGISLPVCIVALGVATIVYTFLGGMKSVVWNDCIQLVVYLGGAVLAGVIILTRLPGGAEQIAAFAVEQGKLRLFDLSVDVTERYTLWSGLLGGAFLTLATHGTDQMMVQRYLCARSQRDARRALILSGFVVLLQFALFLLLGVALAAWYARHPPSTPFASNDEVFPTFIVQGLPVGLAGIILAAVFAAAMSTLSSSLNSSSAAAVNDLYRPLLSEEPGAGHLLWVSRLLTVAFGVVQIGIGIAGRNLAQSVVDSVLAIAGFTTGIILGVFFLGVLNRRVTQPAALIGLVGGTALMVAVLFGTPLAWPWFTIVGSLSTVLFGLLAGVFFANNGSAAVTVPDLGSLPRAANQQENDA